MHPSRIVSVPPHDGQAGAKPMSASAVAVAAVAGWVAAPVAACWTAFTLAWALAVAPVLAVAAGSGFGSVVGADWPKAGVAVSAASANFKSSSSWVRLMWRSRTWAIASGTERI